MWNQTIEFPIKNKSNYNILINFFLLLAQVISTDALISMYRVPHNAGEGIQGRWKLLVIGLIFISSQHGCHSDFHVILPETCNLPDTFNLTWIRSMVNLGIREEQTHIILNIIDRKGLCQNARRAKLWNKAVKYFFLSSSYNILWFSWIRFIFISRCTEMWKNLHSRMNIFRISNMRWRHFNYFE